MELKKKVLDILLSAINILVARMPIRRNQITFVSLESDKLEQDLLQLYEILNGQYTIKTVLIRYNKNNLWGNFCYMLNALKQIWYINQSAFVIINDNNYVVSRFKRSGVQVLQVWHATGAIKKFGNCLPREYKIQNYDYVLSNSSQWVEPYSEAFGVEKEQVVVLGMPRVDKLYDKSYEERVVYEFYEKYPQCREKKLILYAPTFRGNIHKGIRAVELDGEKLIQQLGEDYVVMYKRHPLLKGLPLPQHEQLIEVSEEDLYPLFFVSDMLISDYSSIIFDYSILAKPMILYVPDLDEYAEEIGFFIKYERLPGLICKEEAEITEAIINNDIKKNQQNHSFREKYFVYNDGRNTERIIDFINKKMGNKP